LRDRDFVYLERGAIVVETRSFHGEPPAALAQNKSTAGVKRGKGHPVPAPWACGAQIAAGWPSTDRPTGLVNLAPASDPLVETTREAAMAGMTRPQRVGQYDLLQDFENGNLSIRVIRMVQASAAVTRHVHHRSDQVYVALQGEVTIMRGDERIDLAPFEVAAIPRGVAHGAWPRGVDAIVMNISTPALAADDQLPDIRPDIAGA
jgi:mannose-6-phosphate isomerase-like protein (cupin superfamily)